MNRNECLKEINKTIKYLNNVKVFAARSSLSPDEKNLFRNNVIHQKNQLLLLLKTDKSQEDVEDILLEMVETQKICKLLLQTIGPKWKGNRNISYCLRNLLAANYVAENVEIALRPVEYYLEEFMQEESVVSA